MIFSSNRTIKKMILTGIRFAWMAQIAIRFSIYFMNTIVSIIAIPLYSSHI